MTKKKTIDKSIEEIKKALDVARLIVGTKRCIKALKQGQLTAVFVTVNCPENILSDIEHFAQLNRTEVQQLPIPNDELGIICKKVHSISIVAIKK